MRSRFITWVGCVLAIPLPALAGVEFFDVSRDPGAWEAALDAAGVVSKGTVDFGEDPDHGVDLFRGPLTAEGCPNDPDCPVSPGIVLDNMMIDTSEDFDINLVAFGPSQSFGTVRNSVLAQYFIDSMDVHFDDGRKTAVSLDLLSILGSGTVDLAVFDTRGALLGVASVPAPAAGRVTGVLATDGDTIGRVNIFDPADGAEEFTTAIAYNIPEPATYLLLALGGLFAIRPARSRRRRIPGVT